MSEHHAGAMQATVATAALEQGRRLDTWSLGLSVLACAALLWRPPSAAPWAPAALAACMFLGIAQRFVAARVGFDAVLFRRLADAPDALRELDAALAAAGLRGAPAGPPRDLADRMRGAMRLLRLQAACLGAQFLAALVATAG